MVRAAVAIAAMKLSSFESQTRVEVKDIYANSQPFKVEQFASKASHSPQSVAAAVAIAAARASTIQMQEKRNS